MKRILIILLFVFSLTSFGLDLSELISHDYDLTSGITLPESMDVHDFTNFKVQYPYTSTHADNDYFMDDNITNSWYHTDFDADPFDGMIEVLAIGQPSTSTTMTLIIACLVGLLLVSKRTNINHTISKYS